VVVISSEIALLNVDVDVVFMWRYVMACDVVLVSVLALFSTSLRGG
jgi:hypothetical protein